MTCCRVKKQFRYISRKIAKYIVEKITKKMYRCFGGLKRISIFIPGSRGVLQLTEIISKSAEFSKRILKSRLLHDRKPP